MEGEVIKSILYNRDGTVDYVFDNEKLNDILEQDSNISNNKLSFKLPNGDIKEISIKLDNRSYSVNSKEDKNIEEINKIKEDSMYRTYGIITDHIYNFELSYGGGVKGIIMNFNSNTFCIMGVDGMYIIKRNDIESMRPSKISRDKWEESRTRYLESFVKVK